MAPGSPLTAVVDTEARLEVAIAAARDRAEAIRAEARRRASAATAALDAELAAERLRIEGEIAAATAARIAAITTEAREARAHHDGLRDAALAPIVARLLAELSLLVRGEAP